MDSYAADLSLHDAVLNKTCPRYAMKVRTFVAITAWLVVAGALGIHYTLESVEPAAETVPDWRGLALGLFGIMLVTGTCWGIYIILAAARIIQTARRP